MKNLLKVNNEERTVLSRDLYEFLEVRRDFTNWIKGRIKKYNFVENEDFQVISFARQNGRASHGGNNKVDYLISLDMAKELSMIENNEKGRLARKYFIECEKKYTKSLEQKNEPSKDSFINSIEKDLSKIKILENQIELLVKELKPLYESIVNKGKWKANYYYATVAIAKTDVSTLSYEDGKIHVGTDL